MIVLPAAVFAASLVGSTHCVGMCGAFLALATAAPGRDRAAWHLHAAYHAGRLATYTSLGAVAGLVGSKVDLSAGLVGVQGLAATISASLLAVFAIITLLRLAGVRLPAAAIPRVWQRAVERGHRAAWSLGPLPRAAAIGLLTTLLPCGWLYAFVAAAVGVADPFHAALVMGAFWLGTLPAMIALGVGLRSLGGRLAARLPALSAITLLVLCVVTLFGRGARIGLELPGTPTHPSAANLPDCHDATGDDVIELTSGARTP
jgi:sulfite exporter TauE/SafE